MSESLPHLPLSQSTRRPSVLGEVAPGFKPRRSQQKRRMFRLLLASSAMLAAAMLALSAAEVILRAAGAGLMPGIETIYNIFENDGDAHVQLMANRREHHTVLGRTVRIETNSLGLRGPEVTAKAQRERRILVLGDSFPFGHGVEAEEAFPALLQAGLVDLNVTTVNGGVPGFSHAEQLRTLERVAETVAPDLLISCLYGGNDLDGDLFGPKQAVDGRWYPAPLAHLVEDNLRLRLATKSRVAFVLEDFLHRAVPSLGFDRGTGAPGDDRRYEGFPARREFGLFLDAKIAPAITETILAGFQTTLRRIQDTCPEADLVLVLFPHYSQVIPGVYEPHLLSLGLDPFDYSCGLGLQRVAAAMHAVQVPCLDLTSVLKETEDVATCFLLPDDHLSARGHAVVAEALTRFLRQSTRLRD